MTDRAAMGMSLVAARAFRTGRRVRGACRARRDLATTEAAKIVEEGASPSVGGLGGKIFPHTALSSRAAQRVDDAVSRSPSSRDPSATQG